MLLQVYLRVKETYRHQVSLSTANESVRMASFILWQNIMQAGFIGTHKFSDLSFIKGPVLSD